jgi:hypothetical protein
MLGPVRGNSLLENNATSLISKRLPLEEDELEKPGEEERPFPPL